MQLGMLDSSRHKIAGVILAVLALVLSTLAVRTPDAHAATTSEDDWVETTLASMTLEEKVGPAVRDPRVRHHRRHPGTGGRGRQPGDVRRRQRPAS